MNSLKILLRLTRFKSVADVKTSQEIVELVFMTSGDEIDLRASVYLVPDATGRVQQINAEHTAHCDLNPKTRWGLNLSDALEVRFEPCRDGGFFKFREDTHHEVEFTDASQVEALAQSLLSSLESRSRLCEKNSVRRYANDRCAENDPEWLKACEASSKVRNWAMPR